MEKIWILFFSIFFVVDFRLFVKLSHSYFLFMSQIPLNSVRCNLTSFKILVFCRDVLKNV